MKTGPIRAALWYGKHKLAVLPLFGIADGACGCGDSGCSSPGKHPIGSLVPRGLKDATTDAERIKGWWARQPNANVGIRTGAVSNLVVLDVDSRHGGDASLSELCADYGALPQTVKVRTGGGDHYWFRHPGGHVENRVNLRPGIDLKGDDGYVVVPPSLHRSGKFYAFDPNGHILKVPVAPMPPWLLDLARRRDVTAGNDTRSTGDIHEGERNSALYRLARSLKAKGLSANAVRAALTEENAARCKPPLPASEIEGIVNNALRQPDRIEFGADGDDADLLVGAGDREVNAGLPTPKPEIFSDVIGHVIDLFDPHTEADRIAVAAQFIVAFGNAVGHGPHFFVGETEHHLNEFAAIVGTSSRSRKGDAKTSR